MRAAAVNSIFCFFLLGDGEDDVVVVVDDGGGGAVVGEEDSAEGLGAESNFARRLRRSSAEDEGELLGDVSIALLSMFFFDKFPQSKSEDTAYTLSERGTED